MPTFRAVTKEALQTAENILGRPAYIVEIYNSWPRISSKPRFAPMFVGQAICDLYQNDEVLADENLEQFTLDPTFQGKFFMTFSERKEKKFAHYSLTGP